MPSGSSIGAPGALKGLAPVPPRSIARIWPVGPASLATKRRLVSVSYAMPSGDWSSALPRLSRPPPVPSMLAKATLSGRRRSCPSRGVPSHARWRRAAASRRGRGRECRRWRRGCAAGRRPRRSIPMWFLSWSGWKPGKLSVLQDGDRAALAARFEIHRPRAGGEDRVVATEANAVAGPEAGAALADDDLAAGDLLAREDLDPEHVGVGFAAVAAGAESLLVRHRQSFLAADFVDDAGLAAGFFAFAAGFFAAAFLAAGFFALAAGFLAAGFFVAGFASAFFAGSFFAAGFFAAGFSAAAGFSSFAAAGLRLSNLTSVTSSLVSSERWPARRR